MFGFAGKILFVDLTTKSIRTEPLDIEQQKKYLGGFGACYKLAYELAKPGTDAMAPDNPIVFSAGALAGTNVPGAIKTSAVTKLPLTGTFGWSHGSMGFAAMLKYSGYDHLVVTGRSDKPVYIEIVNDDIRIRKADYLWGRNILEVTKELQKETERSSVLCIGRAGENLVKLALGMIDSVSTLGQGGLGAVMGSKKLKAIVIYGTKGIKISDKKRFSNAINSLKKRYMEFKHRDSIVQLGMMAGYKMLLQGYFSTKHMDSQEITEIYGVEQYKKTKIKGIGCPGCLVADKEVLKIKDEKFGKQVIPTTAYMEIPAFGTEFAIKSLPEAGYLFDLCNKHGISSQTLGGFLSFIIELYEHKILSRDDFDGLDIKRDFATIESLIKIIVNRVGIGDCLADGWQAVINRFGKECEKYAYTIKGSNVLWDPRLGTMGTMEFAQIVSPKGPYSAFGGSPTTVPNLDIDFFKRHCSRVGASDEQIKRIFDSALGFNVGRIAACFENWVTILSSLGICNRSANDRYYSASICAELYSAATGLEITPSEMVKAADRIWAVTRAINVREGFTKKDDTIPQQWFKPMKTFDGKEHVTRDYFKNKILDRKDLSRMLDDYYIERGWDINEGIPTKERLGELGLEEMIPDMSKS